MQLQREVLSTPRDVLVATPGRLLQLLQEGAWYAGDVRFLVVDEADTLFDKGFGPDVEALLAPVLAVGAQVVLVTATLTKPVEALLAARLPDVRRCATSSLHRAVAGAKHRFLDVPGDADKLDTLRTLLAGEGGRAMRARTMVFCNTLPSCRAVEHALAEAGLRTVSYHGDMAGEARVESVRAFNAGGDAPGAAPAAEGADADEQPPIMVCTDLAARGLDFGCSVNHVVMFDFPLNPVDYLHRTGRTARAGTSGRITSLITKRDRVLATQIEDNIRRGGALDALSSSKSAVMAQKRAVAASKPPRGVGTFGARKPYGAPAAGRRTGASATGRGTRGESRAGGAGAGAGAGGGKPYYAGKPSFAGAGGKPFAGKPKRAPSSSRPPPKGKAGAAAR
jgi:superfamily II DNA/RNA helicase